MLLQAAEQTPKLLREPEPFVQVRELRSFDVVYEIKVYCDDPQAIESLYTALHPNILDVFNQYGVQIMTPAYVSDPAGGAISEAKPDVKLLGLENLPSTNRSASPFLSTDTPCQSSGLCIFLS